MRGGAAALAGRWTLAREIEDRLGPPARFAGEAEIEARGAVWHWRERGELVTHAGRFRAERRYLLCPEPGGFAVAFADGRPFHAIRWAAPEAVHDCPPDRYAVAYDFSAWPVWCSVWTVAGPAKDYTMTSRYARP